MAGDTLGDCPFCGHKESSYDDWDWLGYGEYEYGEGMERERVRIVKCKTCKTEAGLGFRLAPNKMVRLDLLPHHV